MVCREPTAKRGLVRLVRGADSTVQVDETGKANGRGAYLCPYRECWTTGLKRQAVSRALKATITPADRAALEAFATGLPLRAESMDGDASSGAAAVKETEHGTTTE